MQISGKSIKGRRASNQDRIYFDQYGDCFIMAVADGVGGNYGGEIASRVVITQCKKMFEKFVEHPDEFKLKNYLMCIYANSVSVFGKITHKKKKLENMSTTLTVALGIGDKYVVGNIGDSKTILIRSNKLKQISVDHSYLQDYKNKYPEEDIPDTLKEQLGRVITRSISSKEEEFDIFPTDSYFFNLENNDALMLFSDGLILDELTENENYLNTIPYKYSDKVVNKLINDAFQKGSKDNISIVYGSYKKLQNR